MDFDDNDKPIEVPKTRRFVPGRAGKPKPKPEHVSKGEHDVEATSSGPKVESEVYNGGGSVKMEIDPKVDKDEETTEAELMEEDDEVLVEEEDYVVREIDVFFNPSIDPNAKVYVLQYPLRPSWRPYEMDERCEEVRVNPSTSQVEIDLSMNVHSSNYDSEFGSKLDMTKQTLTTTWKQPPTLDYAVGVLSGNKFHLNPVNTIAQLRPSMQYLSSKKKQTEESATTSKRQNKGVQQALTDQKPIQEDSLVSLEYHRVHSELGSKYLKGMMANENSSIDFTMSPDAYINTICRGESNRNSPSTRVLSSLPLKERVQKLLFEGPSLYRYIVLKHYASEYSDEDFLKVLVEDAVLVQGLWTPKTALLNLDGRLVAARDYILSKFSKSLTISYSDVESTRGLRESVKTMLPIFAKERPLLKDWKFREPTDVSFINSHKEIVVKQQEAWTEVSDKLKGMMNRNLLSRI